MNVPSSLEKCPGMAPRAASCVQHASRACEAFLVEQGLDKLVGLLFASVAIEPVVRLRVEPRSEPFGVRFPHFSLQFLAHPATKVRHKIRSLTSTKAMRTTALFTQANHLNPDWALRWHGPLKARQNEVLLSWLEEGFRRRDWAKGPSKKAMRCAIELFQNLTKHASDVSLKVGYDAEGQCHLRSENDVTPIQWDGLQQALAPVVELDMASLKARRLGSIGAWCSDGHGWGRLGTDGPSFVLPRQPCGRMHTFRIRRRKARASRCP